MKNIPNYFAASRFVAVLNDRQEQTHIVLWAILAETLGALWIPWFVELGQSALLSQYFAPLHRFYPTFEGVDAVLLFVNASGAVLAGSATALCDMCKREREAMKDKDKPQVLIEGFLEKTAFAFKGGFLAVYTSFLGAGEHFSDLSAKAHDTAIFVWLVSFMLGPPLYVVSILVGRFAWGVILPRFRRWVPRESKETDKRLTRMTVLLCASIAVASLVAYPKSEGMWLLPFGWLCAVAAFFAGDRLAKLLDGMDGTIDDGLTTGGVNWITVVANFAAILLGCLLNSVSGISAVAAYPALVEVLGRLKGTFGGALSAYAAFAEDVASPVVNHHKSGFAWKCSLKNWFLNIAVGMAFALLTLLPDKVSALVHVGSIPTTNITNFTS